MEVAGGSSLIDPSGLFTGTDLSGQWAAGTNKIAFGSTFDYAVGAVGDLDNGTSTLGTGDVIDSSKTQLTPSPDGIDFGIVGAGGYNALHGSFNKGGTAQPVVKHAVVITYDYTGTLTMADIQNVTPYFGTDGVQLVPVPAAAWMGLSLLGGLGAFSKLRKIRAAA